MTGAELCCIALAERLSLQQRLIALDVETTGITPETDRVVQLAGYVVDPVSQGDGFGYQVTAIGPLLVDPRCPIPAEATAVHGITDAMVAEAPTFATYLDAARADGGDLCELVAADVPYVVVAYNGRFDVRMVAAELTRAGASDAAQRLLAAPLLDPYRIYQRYHPRDLGAAVQQYLGHALEDAHDAQADVVAAVEVLVAQLDQHDDLPRTVAALDDFCAQRDPSWIDRGGKFVFNDKGVPCVNFGTKYKGVPMREIDASFWQWMLRADFDDEVKAIARQALRRGYPAQSPAVAP